MDLQGIPVPVGDRHKPFEEEYCVRCTKDEFRIDGYCSIYCRDMDELEASLAEAREEIERLKQKLRVERDRVLVGMYKDGRITRKQFKATMEELDALEAGEDA